MLSRLLKVVSPLVCGVHCADIPVVIARNALLQEESEEFSGDFQDPINIHIENDRDGCAC
jgi:hypothetical protein